MTESTPIFLRTHTEYKKKKKRSRGAKLAKNVVDQTDLEQRGEGPIWPKYALVIDSETTTDERQTLTFAFYRLCRLEANKEYACVEEGLIYPDDLRLNDPDGMKILEDYASMHTSETKPGKPVQLQLRSRSKVMQKVFWPNAYDPPSGFGALVVGFNLAFDLTRLAIDCRPARRLKEMWSFLMSQDRHPETGQCREDPFRPRIIITPKDSKAAFIRFAGVNIRNKKTGRKFTQYKEGRFLDLRTLGWALRNESFSLRSAAKEFTDKEKDDHDPTGKITLDEINYCRNDVRVTVAILNGMKNEFDLHDIDLKPDRALSPASIAKSYLKQMGIIPPLKKFDLSPEVLGAAMQAYYGGRAECRIRHTDVPIVYTDFLSQYPTVNSLMGLWQMLTAERLRMEDATDDVRKLLANVTTESVFDPDFWKQLTFFALVQPAGDILPVRTEYNGETTNIGINPLTSKRPVWYAGPDLVAATLLSPTHKAPDIVRALRVLPEGQQASLQPVTLRSSVNVDPRKDDFFQKIIEARARVKKDQSLPESERDALSYFLKILANSGSYGLFVEINPERVGKNVRANVKVYSGETYFETTSPIVEPPGVWYCPVFASLITAAGRLLLALLERSVTDKGGSHLLCDTDSLAVVASEAGGLVPCVGGAHRLGHGREAVKALSWSAVQEIVNKFEKLNPYDRDAVPSSILKLEDVNFCDGAQRELYGYAIAAKRYALFKLATDSIHVETAKAHGLGFLFPPDEGFDKEADAPVWVVEAWDWIVRGALGLPRNDPPWFDLPAMMRFKITTRQVLKVLQDRQVNLPYQDRVKPFNFILSPMIDDFGGLPIGCKANHFTLITPYTKDVSRWYGLKYFNVHDDEKQYRLGCPGKRLPSQAEPQRLEDVVSRYRWHPEAKSLAPDGSECGRKTQGLLQRTPVTAIEQPRYIGKETDRRWEQGEDISMLDPKLVEYRPNETARLVCDPELQRVVGGISIRKLAKAADVTENTVKAAKRGDRLQRSTVEKLRKGLNQFLSPRPIKAVRKKAR